MTLLRRTPQVASILVLIWFGGCASLQGTQSDQGQANADAAESPEPSPTTPQSHNPPTKIYEQHPHDPEHSTDWGSVADWAVVVVTSAGVMAAYFTLKKLERQTKAAVDSANAAQRSAEVADAALVITQRAYVSQSFPGLNEILRPDGQRFLDTTVEFTNAGHTPAVDFIHYIDVLELDAPPTLSHILGPDTQARTTTVLGAHATATSHIVRRPEAFFHLPFADGCYKDINEGPQFYCVGWAAYRDSFPGTKPRTLQFCYRLTAIGFVTQRDNASTEQPGKKAPYIFGWGQVGDFNQVDESCQLYDALCANP